MEFLSFESLLNHQHDENTLATSLDIPVQLLINANMQKANDMIAIGCMWAHRL